MKHATGFLLALILLIAGCSSSQQITDQSRDGSISGDHLVYQYQGYTPAEEGSYKLLLLKLYYSADDSLHAVDSYSNGQHMGRFIWGDDPLACWVSEPGDTRAQRQQNCYQAFQVKEFLENKLGIKLNSSNSSRVIDEQIKTRFRVEEAAKPLEQLGSRRPDPTFVNHAD